MRKVVCAKCQVEFKNLENGIIVAEMFNKNKDIYRLWYADLMVCPKCLKKIITGFGEKPIAEHFQKDLRKLIEDYKEKGISIYYLYEDTKERYE